VQPVGQAHLRVSGKDAVIVTWGTMVRAALEAAEALKAEGVQAGVLDLRWLSPLDETTLRIAVRQAGGRAVIAHEANLTGGFGAEIVARLHEGLNDLNLKVRRVGAPDVRMPASTVLSAQLLPTAQTIAAAVKSVL
jgi:2-oxoisovalerate dehydrogenase E1 component